MTDISNKKATRNGRPRLTPMEQQRFKEVLDRIPLPPSKKKRTIAAVPATPVKPASPALVAGLHAMTRRRDVVYRRMLQQVADMKLTCNMLGMTLEDYAAWLVYTCKADEALSKSDKEQ